MAEQHNFRDDEARWRAVETRDLKADGAFLYAVITTGIFCRPICPSRRPNRKNVRFFDSATAAQLAGFRPCKKCSPLDAQGNTPPAAVLKACQIMEQADEPPTLDQLADAVGLSAHYFHRLFKRTVGITPKAYASSRRAERFRNELGQDQSITSAMYRAGYGASSRCYEDNSNNLGMTPTAFKNGGSGQTIRYSLTSCHLGWVAVAATSRGLCMIELGDEREQLQREVLKRFPKAVLEGEDISFSNWVAQVVTLIAAPQSSCDLPFDVQGTVFQRKVWEALKSIPVGATATYTEIAEAIGQPQASRAVARACATNPLAVAIPCHRVVRKDGSLSGYRWGLERKRQLLEDENSACSASELGQNK